MSIRRRPVGVSTVLLVGGGGYVGSVLAQELLERGYAVRILDRLYFGDHGLTGIRDRVDLTVGDMRIVSPALLDDVEAVVNVGGLSNDPTAEYNPKANYEMNMTASVALARMAREQGVRRYIYASSCSIYDRGVGDEARDVLLDEKADVDPPGAYAGSKLAAERELLEMTSDRFCVAVLRKATLFGFSPRMRYDLVVNTFVKDALSKGYISLHFGGEMWRPLAEVHDAARAYIALIRADHKVINGEIFNLVYRNFRISELAMRVRAALNEIDVPVEIRTDYSYRGVRNYRVSGHKLDRVLEVAPEVTVEESVQTMVKEIRRHNYTDFDSPRYYNIAWMKLLQEAQGVIQVTGSVFDLPKGAKPLREVGS
ncbi:MAG: SDR family oxidoreductase [Chloroflexi bacterium]|nr:MAG: SDR family oxidoreductase [Chloroflexota bacterium]TME47493.1 MAG: SDR family oxidoreductase [Chloroflexota bacterium]